MIQPIRKNDPIFQDLISEDTDVALVLMPYTALQRPSLALGLLKSSFAETGIGCGVIYANILFARWIGFDSYRLVETGNGDLRIGDWTFAQALFFDHQTPAADFLEEVSRNWAERYMGRSVGARTLERIAAALEEVRAAAPGFIDGLARSILKKRPGVVGCSSTFHQHIASLALLRRIKELSPGTVTVIGGANCEGIMGVATVRAFPWVDIAFSGEADTAFAPLCRALLHDTGDGGRGELPEGAIDRVTALRIDACREGPVPRATVREMDALPVPDYSDYFRALELSGFQERIRPALVMESSRGCWWMDRKGCSFCGLNPAGSSYRSKSPGRIITEMKELSARSGLYSFEMVDNVMDVRHVSSLFPSLIKAGRPYDIFFEVRPDLNRDQVRTMARAGVIWIQPGIEALHDGLLGLLNKGVTAVAGIQLLKYAREYGVRVLWHLLHTIPGARPIWYFESAQIMPLISHLPCPSEIMPVAFHRFADYHSNPDAHGLELNPLEAYRQLYPLPEETIADLACSFSRSDKKLPWPTTLSLLIFVEAANAWKRSYNNSHPPLLCMTDRGESIDIFDTRPCAPARRTMLTGTSARIYRICDAAEPKEMIEGRLREETDISYRPGEISEAIKDLKERKLLLEVSGKLLSLAVPDIIPEPVPVDRFPCGFASRADVTMFSARSK